MLQYIIKLLNAFKREIQRIMNECINHKQFYKDMPNNLRWIYISPTIRTQRIDLIWLRTRSFCVRNNYW